MYGLTFWDSKLAVVALNKAPWSRMNFKIQNLKLYDGLRIESCIPFGVESQS